MVAVRRRLGSVIAGLAALANILGFNVGADEQAQAVKIAVGAGTLITGGIELAGSALALWGRLRATKAIR